MSLRAELPNDSGGADPVAGLTVSVTGNACNVVSSSGQTDAQGLFTVSRAPTSFDEACESVYQYFRLVLSWPSGGIAFEGEDL